MWPWDKIKELERRVEALEKRDCAPTMRASAAYQHLGSYMLRHLLGWDTTVKQSDAILAILHHLNLELWTTPGSAPRVEVRNAANCRIVNMAKTANEKRTKGK